MDGLKVRFSFSLAKSTLASCIPGSFCMYFSTVSAQLLHDKPIKGIWQLLI
jgi:hypothetical protein